MSLEVYDAELLDVAIAAATGIQREVSPNPGVGAAVRTLDGRVFTGHTQPPPGAHGEVVAMAAAASAGASLVGATLATTLEPCNHQGRTGPCTEALLQAKIKRVIVGLGDPDPLVAGTGNSRLRAGGVDVVLVDPSSVPSQTIESQLRFYLHHRRTGRPFVTLKLASSMDGRTAAPDRSSQWITGSEARTDGHRLRALHDAIVVGAGTVRSDNPALTVRHVDGPDPVRVVLGRAPTQAKVHPCLETGGDLDEVLCKLGANGITSILVEGGATVANAFHMGGLVNEYVLYLAPVFFGGSDAMGLFQGKGVGSIDQLWRGAIQSIERLGADVRLTVVANTEGEPLAR